MFGDEFNCYAEYIYHVSDSIEYEFFWGGHLQISVSLCKDEPETGLLSLMRSEGVRKIRTALASYVDFLKTGKSRRDAKISTMHVSFRSIAAAALSIGCELL